MPPTNHPRLDQTLSRCGYCSRREARDWIKAGRVTVERLETPDPTSKVDPATVRVDGEPLESPHGILALLHKPPGTVCSKDDREGPTIYDLLPPRWQRRNPAVTTVGRLDKDATGLLILTDLGELVHRWTSPRKKVPKLYEVTVDHDLDASLVGRFASGTLLLEGESTPCAPAKLTILSPQFATLELTEGRYHQVKRMFGDLGWNVLRLHRTKFGPFNLGTLAPGRILTLDVNTIPIHGND